MERVELLKQLSFGAQVAEEETNALARYFVETHQWSKIANGEVDLIRGDKGAGKSAIYSLLMERQSDFFDDGILITGAENPRGDTVFKDIIPDPPASEIEFIALWKLYILVLMAKEFREYDVKSASSAIVFTSLEDAGLIERERSGILRRVQEYVKKLVNLESLEGGITLDPNTGMLTGLTGRIVTRKPHGEFANKGVIVVDDLFAHIENTLDAYGLKFWVLLDRLDIAFIENHALEANALRALFRVYADFRKYTNISIKIFLR